MNRKAIAVSLFFGTASPFLYAGTSPNTYGINLGFGIPRGGTDYYPGKNFSNTARQGLTGGAYFLHYMSPRLAFGFEGSYFYFPEKTIASNVTTLGSLESNIKIKTDILIYELLARWDFSVGKATPFLMMGLGYNTTSYKNTLEDTYFFTSGSQIYLITVESSSRRLQSTRTASSIAFGYECEAGPNFAWQAMARYHHFSLGGSFTARSIETLTLTGGATYFFGEGGPRNSKNRRKPAQRGTGPTIR